MSFFEKHKKLIALIATTIIVFIFMGLSTIPTESSFIAENLVHSVISPLQQGVMEIANGIGGFFRFISEMKSFKAENNRLTEELHTLQRHAKSTEEYKVENERLRALLDLKNTMPDTKTTAAKVIGRGPDNWFNYIIINKGTKDDITKKDIVITNRGLVGNVFEVGYNWAKIATVIDSNSSVGGIVARTSDIAMVEGDVNLSIEGLCTLTYMSKDAGIVQGDIVETSGLGGIYPPGIAVGRVEEIKADASGTYAIIRPIVDMANVKEVLVLKRVGE